MESATGRARRYLLMYLSFEVRDQLAVCSTSVMMPSAFGDAAQFATVKFAAAQVVPKPQPSIVDKFLERFAPKAEFNDRAWRMTNAAYLF